MQDERRHRVFRAMALVYLLLGISLVYFLFFNSGLSVRAQTSAEGENSILVSNHSVHAIRDVDVGFVKSNVHTTVQKIPLMNPNQEMLTSIKPEWAENGRTLMQASAPFHLSAQTYISSQSSGEDVPNATFSFSFDSIGFVGKEYGIFIEGCSQEAETIPLRI